MDKEIRNKNLYDALISHIEYATYLENYGDENIDFSRINFNLLIALFLGNYLEGAIDPYINKVCNDKGEVVDVKIELVPEYLDFLASKIATNNGNGYTIGELSYKNASVLLDKLRNKLAHGAFILKDNSIIFEEKGLKGIVKIDDILKIVADLDLNVRKYKLYGESVCIDSNAKYVKDRVIHGAPSFKKFCNDLFVMKITNKPKEGHARTMEYVQAVNEIEALMGEIFIKYEFNEKGLETFFNKPKVKMLMEAFNIEIKYEIKSVSELEYYDVIKSNYFSNDYVKQLYGAYLAKWICDRLLKLERGKFQNYNLNKGILLNLTILKAMRDTSIYNFIELTDLLSKLDMAFIFFADIDNAIAAADIVAFNSFYQYGLEDSLSVKNQESIYNLATNKTIDFSLFDLSLLECDNMVISNNFDCFNEEIKKYKKEITGIEKLIESRKKAISNYLEFDKHKNKEELERKKEQLKEAYKLKSEQEYKIELCEYYLNNMDFNSYVKNFNIISCIRNANSHGSIKLDEHNQPDDTSQKVVKVTNEYNGTIYYDKELPIYDFSSLFKMGNFYVLHDFYASKLEDKSLIDYDYIEFLNDRIDKRKEKN